MKVTKDKVVSIHYSLKDSSGILLETSENEEPLSYIHGSGFLIPGLEKILEGKSLGDSFSTKIKPEEGYGEYDKKLVFTLEKSEFPEGEPLEVGMQFFSHSEKEDQLLTVTKISGDTVTVDANHPLAGKELFFEVSVAGIRDASPEELDHGHVHDGHTHHH